MNDPLEISFIDLGKVSFYDLMNQFFYSYIEEQFKNKKLRFVLTDESIKVKKTKKKDINLNVFLKYLLVEKEEDNTCFYFNVKFGDFDLGKIFKLKG